MSGFLLGTAIFILAIVAVALARILRGPDDADRMMAAQLLGTGGVAALLVFGVVTDEGAALNVGLTIALLASFATVTFYKSAMGSPAVDGEEGGRDDES